mmetsp:Transcript_33085/g.87326  ORF Transcript_33085/g.87326 Transcript_33085/m.87326 type:complete len:217 (-) Transcript_33085:552-1202(-)
MVRRAQNAAQRRGRAAERNDERPEYGGNAADTRTHTTATTIREPPTHHLRQDRNCALGGVPPPPRSWCCRRGSCVIRPCEAGAGRGGRAPEALPQFVCLPNDEARARLGGFQVDSRDNLEARRRQSHLVAAGGVCHERRGGTRRRGAAGEEAEGGKAADGRHAHDQLGHQAKNQEVAEEVSGRQACRLSHPDAQVEHDADRRDPRPAQCGLSATAF